jgi:hypothetical protein
MTTLKRKTNGQLLKLETGALAKSCCCGGGFCDDGDCESLPASLVLDLSTIEPCESCTACTGEYSEAPDYGSLITLTRGPCFGTPIRTVWTASPDSGGAPVCIGGRVTTTSMVRLTYFSETCDFVLEWSCLDPSADGQFRLVVRAIKSASGGDPTGSYTITDSACDVTGTVDIAVV